MKTIQEAKKAVLDLKEQSLNETFYKACKFLTNVYERDHKKEKPLLENKAKKTMKVLLKKNQTFTEEQKKQNITVPYQKQNELELKKLQVATKAIKKTLKEKIAMVDPDKPSEGIEN